MDVWTSKHVLGKGITRCVVYVFVVWTVLKLLIIIKIINPSELISCCHSQVVKSTKTIKNRIFLEVTWLRGPEDVHFTVLRNVGKCLPVDTAWHPWRRESSSTTLWWPQTSYQTKNKGIRWRSHGRRQQHSKVVAALWLSQRPHLLCRIASFYKSVRSVGRDVRIRCKI